jgi:DNA-binding NarL/FixJ family response regulator
MPDNAIKILVVDDHSLVRESIAKMLGAEADISIVGTLGDASDVVKNVKLHQPDIVLMDIDMPGVISFDVAKHIVSLDSAAKVVFLSAHSHDHYIEGALKVGAMGYLTKSSLPAQLIKGIRQVADGQTCYSPEIRARIVIGARGKLQLAQNEPRTLASTLTSREVDILTYLARGLSKKQIAQTIHVSLKTVEGHAERLMTKLNIHDRVELARYAIRERLIDP